MKSLSRLAFLLLLAIAVPVQGMAAVAAGQCMAFGHHDAAASQEHDAHAHDDGADGHGHTAQQQADDSKSPHCGPCTACCASASIAAPAVPAVLAARSYVEHFFSQLAPPAAEPHRFDRPPLPL